MSLVLPSLPYTLDALEPGINKELLELHYMHHHAAYIAGYNDAQRRQEQACATKDLAQEGTLQKALAFHMGGHINHSLFWENLAPQEKGGGTFRPGPLHDFFTQQFGSTAATFEAFFQEALGIQGSGWAWICLQGTRAVVTTTANHETPRFPLLCIDLWEHAYYLQYRNKKGEFLHNIWMLINWDVVEHRLRTALAPERTQRP